MAVTISGMFGSEHTYFADSPVVINISGLQWPETSPFKIVRVHVIYDGATVSEFHGDTGGQSEISFDISSALRTIWSDYDFAAELAVANSGGKGSAPLRGYRSYSLQVFTEYMASDDGGVFTQTGYGPFTGGRCAIGGMTEWERSEVEDTTKADLSAFEGTNQRNGDASTKPKDAPERVGKSSITSFVDISNAGTQTTFYAADEPDQADSMQDHVPTVVRDSQDYADFLFVNRRGAVETCSGMTFEAMLFEINRTRYNRIGRPAFKPTRTVTTVGSTPRRSWPMSSGLVTREWADWWQTEFVAGRRHWMLWKGPGAKEAQYVPVIVEPAKKNATIYDRAKQQMQHVDFTVTLALEG